MKTSRLQLCSAPWPRNPTISYIDYKIGRIQLSRHLQITDQAGALSVSEPFARQNARQMLLMEASDFRSGRVALYVCALCGDPYCGALTVRIEKTDDGILWHDFGWEDPDGEYFSPTEYSRHTGPFLFDAEDYRITLWPYTR
jgi:hypothetical protein